MGPWTILPMQGTLSGSNGPIHLEPKLVSVLTYLAERAGEVIPRSELIEEVWPGTVVTDEVLTRCISQLRAHLGDSSASPSYIRTVPKRGYSLIVAVEALGEQDVESAAGGITRPRMRKNTALALLFIVIGALLVIGQGLWDERGSVAAQTQLSESESKSIAILPFVNLSEDPENQYFSEGLAEDLLNGFTRIEGLQVAARSSSFAFKDKLEDVRSIGRKLNVSTVLEGSVRKVGNRVRITAQLVNVADGFHLWSGTFDRELGDVFAIQDEITRHIVETLELTLLGGVEAETGSIQAYDFYLLGRHHWHQRTATSLAKAVNFFTHSIEHDADYALAYSGLADAYLLLSSYGDLPFEEALQKVEPAIEKALTLNPDLAEGHASLGLLRQFQGDFADAEAAHRRALELDPNNAMAYMWLGNTLAELGRPLESGQAYAKAIQLEPLHPTINKNLITWLIGRGSLQAARVHLDEWTSDQELSTAQSHLLVKLLTAEGRFDEAVSAAAKAVEAEPDSSYWLSTLALTYARIFEVDTANRYIREARDLPVSKEDWPFMYTDLLMISGQYEKLAEYLQMDLTKEDLSEQQRARNYAMLGIAQFHLNNFAEAAVNLELALQVDSEKSPEIRLDLIHYLAYFAQELGKADETTRLLDIASNVLAQARAQGWQTKGIILQTALSHTFRNQASAAIDLLNELVAADCFVVSRLGDDRRFWPLKSEVAFQQLVVAAQTENNRQRGNATGT